MAKLFPKIAPDTIKNHAEQRLAEALKMKLPADVCVYHSFEYLSKQSDQSLREGECDFVILDPNNGLLFVEVKGGNPKYDNESGSWYYQNQQERVTMKKDPLEQARYNCHKVIDLIKESLRPQTPAFTYGYAVAFPYGRFYGAPPIGTPTEYIIDSKGCENLTLSIQKIFDLIRGPATNTINSSLMRGIQNALQGRFDILPVIWQKLEDQEAYLHRATDEQKKVLGVLSNYKHALFQGTAGSGKTILAIAKAQQMAAEDKKTVLLFYNKEIKNWVKQTTGTVKNLSIETYHSLAKSFCKKAGIDIFDGQDTDDPKFWNEYVPNFVETASETLTAIDKYDAVIIDEGQDFNELWWITMESLFKDPKNKECYYVFYDPNQNIYLDEVAVPVDVLGPPCLLHHNCRNTVKIAEHCAKIIGIDSVITTRSPPGSEPDMRTACDLKSAVGQIKSIVQKWTNSLAGGLKYSQIAILSSKSTIKSFPDSKLDIPFTTDFGQWRNNKGVLLATWGRFKGLEADAIIIIEPALEKYKANSTRYVARSRAKHLLTVIELSQ